MKLTDVFNSGQLKNINTQTTGSQSAVGSLSNASVGRQIQALTPGQTLQGEVISREGNQVQIRVADDFVLEAKVDQSIHLEVGKTMTFEVRNNGQTLQLSPLFANTATQVNALKALEMAALPITQDTVTMTGLMMEAGLPIDRNTLQQMFREVNTFLEANVSDVVDLHRLGIVVSEENLAQVSSYKNLTHQLVDGMHTIQGALPDALGAMVAEGNVEGAAGMFRDLLQLVQGLSGDAASGVTQGGLLQDGTGQASATQVASHQIFVDGSTPEQGEVSSTGVQTDIRSIQAGGMDASVTQLQEVLTNAVKQMNSGEDVLNLMSDAQSGTINVTDNTMVSLQNDLTELVRFAGQNDIYDDLLQQLSKALQGGTATDQAKALQQLLARGMQDGNIQLLETLMNHKGSWNILSDGFSQLWTIAPEDVADSGKVEELYTRLNKQLKELSNILEQNGQNQSEAFKAVGNMSQNIDFLQQINQAYTYVQLPLRLQSGDTHGDLYVYTNKRNLSAKDGQISALLHLDMEHLGPVDVYVAMQADNVNTRFYLQDDEMLDFLEQHMDLLTQRLQKRGYNCDFAMQVRDGDNAESGLKGLFPQEQAQPIAQYAFDVRA